MPNRREWESIKKSLRENFEINTEFNSNLNILCRNLKISLEKMTTCNCSKISATKKKLHRTECICLHLSYLLFKNNKPAISVQNWQLLLYTVVNCITSNIQIIITYILDNMQLFVSKCIKKRILSCDF